MPVPEDQLPVLLPDLEDFHPTDDGRSPLARVEDWVHTTCPDCGGPAHARDRHDGHVRLLQLVPLPLRLAARRRRRRSTASKVEYWLPVDLYVGGAEHAVMHLLYARFFCKVTQDAGYVSFGEPYARLRNQGMIQAEDGQKMSKSKGNVVTPDSVVEQYGADALRVYELFIAPFEQSVAWSDRGVQGTLPVPGALLEPRLNEIVEAQGSGVAADEAEAEKGRQVLRTLNKTIRKVTRDMDAFRFNTAVSALMELQNEVLDVWTGARGALTLAQWREVVSDDHAAGVPDGSAPGG